MGQRCSDTRGITFEDVVVKQENVLIGEVSMRFEPVSVFLIKQRYTKMYYDITRQTSELRQNEKHIMDSKA